MAVLLRGTLIWIMEDSFSNHIRDIYSYNSLTVQKPNAKGLSRCLKLLFSGTLLAPHPSPLAGKAAFAKKNCCPDMHSK